MLAFHTVTFNYYSVHMLQLLVHHYKWSLVYVLGIAVTGASNVSTDLVAGNQIADYSFVIQPFTLDPFDVILRCASGLGLDRDGNTALGIWYFDGYGYLPLGTNCILRYLYQSVFEVRRANPRRFPGVINLYLCSEFSIETEGIYSCIMMNSSMIEQTMRVGVYLSGRSESLDMYPITSLLIIFHLSTQLLQ